jgi:hypothetical protein
MEDKELVWLPKKIADIIKLAESEKAQEDIVIGYLDESRKDVRNNLEGLDYDLLQYRATMAKTKQAFRDAMEEQLEASNDLWENIDSQIPKLRRKIQPIVDSLKPVVDTLNLIDTRLKSINTYQLERIHEILCKIQNSSPSVLKAIGLFVKEEEEE